ncbi:MAG: ACP phosphodiesterase [Ginsengibacter sp.]
MNYLAHAYLSFNHPEILVGNMISDFVKGKKQFDYPETIHKGIVLHRRIDEYTDMHPQTKRAKEFFKADYRLYSGAFVDVIYDHFLACDKNEFPNPAALAQFSRQVYITLESYSAILPDPFLKMLPYMKSKDWLLNYRQMQGLEKSLQGVVHRALYLHESAIAFSIFNDAYLDLRDCYEHFFPELKKFTVEQVSNLLDN